MLTSQYLLPWKLHEDEVIISTILLKYPLYGDTADFNYYQVCFLILEGKELHVYNRHLHFLQLDLHQLQGVLKGNHFSYSVQHNEGLCHHPCPVKQILD